MLSLDKLRVWLRMLFARKREVQRLDAELNFHLEELTAENIARGMSPTEARQKALRAFGNPMLVREQAGDTWSWNRLELPAHNVRIGIRTLARTPGFAIVSILIIAIGIGTNAALFMEMEYPKVHAAPSSAHCPEAGRSTGIAALGCGPWHAATSAAALSHHPVGGPRLTGQNGCCRLARQL